MLNHCPKTHWLLEYIIKIKEEFHLNKLSLKIFDRIDIILTGLQFSSTYFLSFLYNGVTSSNLGHGRNKDDLIEQLMIVHRNQQIHRSFL